MSQDQIKVPKQGGLDEARRRLNELRRREPSPELVKLVEEVTRKKPEQEPGSDPGIAARPISQLPRDLDL